MPAVLLLITGLASALSTCVPLPLAAAVSRATIILHGRVARVVYLNRDGLPETDARQKTDSCGPKLSDP